LDGLNWMMNVTAMMRVGGCCVSLCVRSGYSGTSVSCLTGLKFTALELFGKRRFCAAGEK
jgi:hypothetical protein